MNKPSNIVRLAGPLSTSSGYYMYANIYGTEVIAQGDTEQECRDDFEDKITQLEHENELVIEQFFATAVGEEY